MFNLLREPSPSRSASSSGSSRSSSPGERTPMKLPGKLPIQSSTDADEDSDGMGPSPNSIRKLRLQEEEEKGWWNAEKEFASCYSNVRSTIYTGIESVFEYQSAHYGYRRPDADKGWTTVAPKARFPREDSPEWVPAPSPSKSCQGTLEQRGRGTKASGSLYSQKPRRSRKKNKSRNSRSREKSRQRFGCSFCFNNRSSVSFPKHSLKKDGVVTCPLLRKLVCPICGATGDNAHTKKFCPQNTDNDCSSKN